MTIARFDHVSTPQFAADAAPFPDAMPVNEIPLPRRATKGSAGYDFVSPVTVSVAPGESVTLPTGVRAFMEPGWVLLLFPRSSLGFKHEMRLSNTVGVVDGDYVNAANEGHILVRLHNGGDHDVRIAAGDRFCQGLFLPVGLAQEEEAAGERTGGFGSTGR